jgi:hypothetical protein
VRTVVQTNFFGIALYATLTCAFALRGEDFGNHIYVIRLTIRQIPLRAYF